MKKVEVGTEPQDKNEEAATLIGGGFYKVAEIGKHSKTVTVFDHIFDMHALTQREMILCAQRTAPYLNTLAYDSAYRVNLLSLALDTMDYDLIYKPVGPDDDIYLGRLHVIENWYPQVVEALYAEYITLSQEADGLVESLKKS